MASISSLEVVAESAYIDSWLPSIKVMGNTKSWNDLAALNSKKEGGWIRDPLASVLFSLTKQYFVKLAGPLRIKSNNRSSFKSFLDYLITNLNYPS